MQIVPSSFIALAAIAVLLMQGPRRGFWAFLALTPLGAAAAFNLPAVGGASIIVMQLAVLALLALIVSSDGGIDRFAGSLRPGQPGFWMGLLLIYGTLSALVGPRLFEGMTDVFSIARSETVRGIIEVPLRATKGNLTQLFTLTLGGLTFLACATLFRSVPDRATVLSALAVATGVNIALGWIDVASHAVGMPWLLDPIHTANYAILDTHRMIGLKRMIGGFAEASSFGAYSLGLFAFWLQLWLGGRVSVRARWLLVLSLIAVLRSTSSGAYVGLTIYLLLTAGWLVAGHLRASMPRRLLGLALAAVAGLWLAAVLIFAAYHFSDPFNAFLDRALFDKLETSSGVERMSWNAQALRNFADTWGIGAGLGSVRASNWLLATLGSLGLPGTAIYVALLVSIFRTGRGVRDPQTLALIRALKAACLALFLTDLLTASTPNLGLFFFALAGTATGLARGAVLGNDVPQDTPVARLPQGARA